MYFARKTCRLCNDYLTDVVSLGPIYLSTFLGTNDSPPLKVPIDLVKCTRCHLYQLRHTVDPNALYDDYWYQSGLNQSMIIALKDVVEKVKEHITLNPGDVVVDIGANDGTLLGNYDSSLIRVGFEPSNIYKLSADSNQDRMIHDYFSERVFNEHFPEKKARVITAIAMFYDLENPHTFVEDLYNVLADNGLLVIQMMDFKSMVELGDFPNMCHEHLEYYTLDVLDSLLISHGLEIFDLEYNGVNGGSLRVYVRHDTGQNTKKVLDAIVAETQFFQNLGDPAQYFKDKIEDAKHRVVTFIRDNTASGAKVAVLGASTKGNTTLQFFGLDENDIIHAAEVNPDKFGKRTVGSNIPIIPEKESLSMNPDYYLILPWGFIDFFIEKFFTYLYAGGKFIVPLPEPRLIMIRNDAIMGIPI